MSRSTIVLGQRFAAKPDSQKPDGMKLLQVRISELAQSGFENPQHRLLDLNSRYPVLTVRRNTSGAKPALASRIQDSEPIAFNNTFALTWIAR